MVRVNYPELGGVMTKKEFIERAKAAGWTVEANEMDGYQAGKFSRKHFNRLPGGIWNDAQQKYEEKMSIKKMYYSIHIPGQRSYYDITKTEYQYFQSLCGLDGYVKSSDSMPSGYLSREQVKAINAQAN